MDDNRQLRIFYIARVYQLARQFWLAMGEYKKIMDSRDQFGSNHAFVLESERTMTKLRGLLAAKRGNFI